MQRERPKVPLGLRIALFSGGLVLLGGTAALAIEGTGGSGEETDDQLPQASDFLAELTPTPTSTPRTTIRSLTEFATAAPTPAEVTLWTNTPDSSEIIDLTTIPTPTPRISAWTPSPAIQPVTPAPTQAPTPESTPVFEEKFRDDWADRVFTLINEFRDQNGIGPLERDSNLDEAAKNYAKFLLDRDEILDDPGDHNLDGTPLDRATRARYNEPDGAFWVGEVVAGDRNSPEGVVEWWKNSPPHRAALLSFANPEPDLRIEHVGVGCYQGFFEYRYGGETALIVYCAAELAIPN